MALRQLLLLSLLGLSFADLKVLTPIADLLGNDNSVLEGTVPGTSKVGSSKAVEVITWKCIQSCDNNNLWYQVGKGASDSQPRCKGLLDQNCFTWTTLVACNAAITLDPENGSLRGQSCTGAAEDPGWCAEATKQLATPAGAQTQCTSTTGAVSNFTYCAYSCFTGLYYVTALSTDGSSVICAGVQGSANAPPSCAPKLTLAECNAALVDKTVKTPARSCSGNSESSWCQDAISELVDGTGPAECTTIEPWNCIQACPNSNLWYQVRSSAIAGGNVISCRGYTGESCMSWYSNATCVASSGISISQVYDTTGLSCSSGSANAPAWCAEGTNVLVNNNPNTKCSSTPGTPVPSWKCIRDCTTDLYNIVAASTDKKSVYCRGYSGDLVCSFYDTLTECNSALADTSGVRVEETCDPTSTATWCKEAWNQTVLGLAQSTCGGTPPPPPPPPPGNSSWTCIQSCTDQGKFVAAQSNNGQIQCFGNSPNCNWYSSLSQCQSAIPSSGGSVGAVCTSVTTGGWCQEANQQIVLKMAQTVCPSISWKCIQSCGNSAPNFVAVAIGTDNSNIICYGPSGTQCYWFGTADQCNAAITGGSAKMLERSLDETLNAQAFLAGQDEERGYHATGLVLRHSGSGASNQGYQMCTGYPSNSWCWEGKNQLINNQPQTQCGGSGGGWTCIQSCQDNKRWVQARSITVAKKRWNSNQAIQCAGYQSNSCQWYDSQSQCQAAIGQVPAGRVCDQYVSDWCKEGALQFWNHASQTQC